MGSYRERQWLNEKFNNEAILRSVLLCRELIKAKVESRK